ncbi:hypothetical protein GIS00_24925 [Nakamurella sp. YIM 132087]|uniref:DUF222 domain-containing protein n=1 Tax=Nakamurella alba TaxID=2665158 RepID=A0A7K1FSQ3_9ACTN|nr:hypothetical protein [Nakamurella alba]MTD17182.1 hypothetical protein [Nakamurella alba]
MQLQEMYDYIAALLADAAIRPDDEDETAFELRKLALIARARVVLDIIEAQTVHELRSTVPQTSYGDIGLAQGISKQASRIRHTKLDQVLKVHQLDGRRHSMSKAVVPPRHRRTAAPTRRARREGTTS